MRCASCDEVTSGPVCTHCGQDPLLEGRYQLEAVIGQGTSGTVYRALDTHTDTPLAIKALPFHHTLDATTRALFEREGQVLSQLSHPAIPAWHGQLIAGQGRGRTLYLLQEFVAGTALSEELKRKRYTESGVLAIVEELLGILSYLHRLSPPVIHRDIKPSNIMRRPDGSLALIDFGSVRDALQRTMASGTVAGTFGFMAPEQFAGEASPATDIYGLGATAVALLSRKDPATLHTRDGGFKWRGRIAVQPQVETLIGRMLEPDPRKRAADAAQLRSLFKRVRAGEVLPSPRPARVLPEGRTSGEELRVITSTLKDRLLGSSRERSIQVYLGLFAIMMTLILSGLSVLFKWLMGALLGL